MKHGLIIAGGSGSRLWPLSREDRPKQFLPMADGRTLLEHAWARLDGLVESKWVCASERWRAEVTGALKGLDDARYLGEPEGRGTLAALAFSCSIIAQADPEAVVAVFTADHIIEPLEALHAGFVSGFRLLERTPDVLLTFGIAPTFPATAYGYLELGDSSGDEGARAVLRFREKPDLLTAESCFSAGALRFLWNSGMFLWRARTFLDLVNAAYPDMNEGMKRIAQAWNSPTRMPLLSSIYTRLPSVSVDHGLMEPISNDKPGRLMTMPLSLEWKDIGSWDAYASVFTQDSQENVHQAALEELLDCRRTMVVSTDPKHLVVAMGCEDLVIVHTPTTTLVCSKARAADLKQLQHQIIKSHGNSFA